MRERQQELRGLIERLYVADLSGKAGQVDKDKIARLTGLIENIAVELRGAAAG